MNFFLQAKSLSEQDTVIVIMIIVAIAFYFIPSIIALIRWKKNLVAIIALNFFLGWSLIGWVVSLVWSLSSDSKPQPIVVKSQTPITKEDGIDKLTKLKKLLDDGAITQDEYDHQKSKILKKR
ncbi:superinfection immunity protein [Aquimarina sp. AD10]|uniref:superinfection immunity protein n=1 Tax=Aquimarina TaxID=290174 RepID=UPI0009EF5662|nr:MULTISPECIES: superinfection immunity protein [Aquimarina]AXT60240.1 superinfection immunity protein [Aquimarina sp. AD10]RKN01354.1 superinfection immunity protein [Aquimarina sp. AD10]